LPGARQRSAKIETDIQITGPVAGACARIAALHADYYGRNWGFGAVFEETISHGVVAFLERFDPRRDGFWTVCLRGQVAGAIAIDGIHADTEGAHLRWFILDEGLRGRGLGNRLLARALAFGRERGHPRIYLWTFEGLQTARHLYEKYGFALVAARPGSQWGKEVIEQRFVLDLTV
jgi:GNAT superfamily N-acetyltransferase